MLHVFVLVSEAQQGSSTNFDYASDGTACHVLYPQNPTDASAVLHVLLSAHVCVFGIVFCFWGSLNGSQYSVCLGIHWVGLSSFCDARAR